MIVMSTADENGANGESQQIRREEFPPVPESAIVKPEDERPEKMQIRPEENLEGSESDVGSEDSDSEDMDGDGSPDWVSQ
jgi:hypothetical protein